VVPVTGTGVSSSESATPAILTAGSTTFAGGGGFGLVIENANGTAGSGWGLLDVTGALTITATSSTPFTIGLISTTGTGALGPISNFNPLSSYSWEIVNATGGISGFTPNAFNFNLSITNSAGFENSTGVGYFFASQSGNDLFVNFTPVPEPSTWALLIGGAAALAGILFRRRGRSVASV